MAIELAGAGAASQTALQLAARRGNHDEAKLLLRTGIDANFSPKGTEYPLAYAIESGDAETVKVLLEYGANIHQASKRHGNALIASIKKGEEEIFDIFLDKFDPNSTDRVGAPALYVAAVGGHEAMVNKLIRRGADVQACHDTIFSPIMGAGLGGSSRIVESMLQNGANSDHAALFAASSVGENELVTQLLLRGADVGRRTLPYDRDLPIHAAMLQGHETTVRILLAAGATLTSRYFPYVFLETASRRHFGISRLILNEHLSGNIRLCLGTSPFPSRSSHIPIALLLSTLKVGARTGNTSLAWEFVEPYGQTTMDFMDYLLTQDSIRLPVDSPKSVLKAAIKYCNDTLLSFLLDSFEVNISRDFPNLIELAVINGSVPTLEVLLKRTTEQAGLKTPQWKLCLSRALNTAVERNNFHMVELLDRYGTFTK
ncbi:TPA_exp: Ankyrin repeat protein [Trichophyton benhamiae CBS 112371]|uniref:Ankyrin repeat protein n=1 Tax=Arthroderma benhamiae (strain ATCC MYA-4681 / CBS 112371) TaxID=663331 RepID=D4AYK1_ARTBC|nr:ankyrin repeat protein [Trichophyton benhamiae CBS 112371]EFE31671.1 ankyrin repeat protein [Trichophyton benhamiae CBS 112371]DAA74805.1 TPA_exp: Ankyrin repeat protein [Trichophyton benhamiae CBS 112371]